MNVRRLFFEAWYWLPGQRLWDMGVPPPELRAVVPDARVTPGRALDLSCGTGTNAVYLAQHGWCAVGVDFARRAIAQAKRRAARAGVADRASFHLADVTRLDVLKAPFDLALDERHVERVGAVVSENETVTSAGFGREQVARPSGLGMGRARSVVRRARRRFLRGSSRGRRG